MKSTKLLTNLDEVELASLLRRLPPWCRFILRTYYTKLKELIQPGVSVDDASISSIIAQVGKKKRITARNNGAPDLSVIS